ncbi:TonB-dependent receptor [Catenovulum sp. 2E275]|uniref:TonB-dependent receptor n=1 Tax=Catenovulum sp. 2E275 TaxID=2980497 RepID=UPI0021D2D0B1|nr:TonB-dependent receptor [Catenovulum sp. 2E275]MCU4676543.1 TonB-dependent receptor [Catenovulum sp. 2E275]
MNNYNQSKKIDSTESAIPHFKQKSLANRIASILFAGAAISAFSGVNAFAAESEQAQQTQNQTDTEASQDDEEMELIQVSGIRYSQLSALDRKKNAGTMMDSLVAEDIGEFPDKNVAEALQRVSGIQLERDMGEGSSVSVRGVESGLVRVEVNGVTAMGMGGSRSVDFRDMASELVKSIDVYKGSEARITEGGVGGTIQINTRKPNEFTDNFFQFNAEAQYNTMIDEYMPKYNLTGVYKVSDRFGFLVNVTASDQHQMFHGLRNTNWQKYRDIDNDPNKTAPDQDFAEYTTKDSCSSGALSAADEQLCEEQWYEYSPSNARYSVWGRQEKRLSANIEAQYQLTDELSFDISYTDSSRNKVATDRNFQVEIGDTFNSTADAVTADKNVYKLITTGRITSDANPEGYLAGATVRNRTLNFDWDQERKIMKAGFDYNKDGLKIEGYIARSTTFEDIDSRDTQSAQNNVGGIVIEQVKGLPTFDFTNAYIINPDDEEDIFNTFNYNDGNQYTSLDRFKYAPSQSDAAENIAKLDVTYIPDSDFFTKFYTGFIMTDQQFANDGWSYNIMQTVGNPYTVDGVTKIWTQDDHEYVYANNRFATDKFFRDYDSGVDIIESYMAIDTEPYLEALLERSGYSSAVSARDNLDSAQSRYDISVKTQSGYAQADFETYLGDMTLKGNFGVRIARTETESEGYTRIRVLVEQFEKNDDGTPVLDDNGNRIPIKGPNGENLGGEEDRTDDRWFEGRQAITEEFIDVLPSLNMTLEMFDGFQAYLGIAKVMARPQINDLNINADCTIHDYPLAGNLAYVNTCRAGNPDLDPYRANQYEVALTWYPDETSILSAAYFVKDITSYVFGAEVHEDVDFFNDGRVWDVTQQTNKQGITTKGVELQASTFFTFLPGFLQNTGAKANYTYITADNVDDFNPLTGEQMPLKGQSENSYNLEGFYEDEDWSIKLTYNYRDEYYARVFDGLPVFVDAAGYIDGKITYRYSDNLKFYVDGRNLGKEAKVENSGTGRINDVQWSGRLFSIGVTYKM